jgi:3-oxo-5-alpha-steroid 4-dehydrogenase 1
MFMCVCVLFSVLYRCILFPYRTCVFPLRTRGGKPTPISLVLMAFAYCTFNGYIQARYLTRFSTLTQSSLTAPHFLIGCAVFAIGMFINMQADHILLNLRKPGETQYKIPRGGMFTYVSGANFFGEIVEWTGFAIAGWSFAVCP